MQFFGYHLGGDGAIFHREGKTLFCHFLEGLESFTGLAHLVVRDAWLDEKTDEQITPNIVFLKEMRANFLKECGSDIPLLDRKALEIFTNWCLVLYKNDLFYFQRIGWMIDAIIQYTDILDDPKEILKQIERNYFALEVRKNRITRMKEIWARFWEAYDQKPWVRDAVGWMICYLGQHGGEFVWRIPGEKKDFSIYDPRNWLGGNTGFGIVNAGEG